MEMSKHNSVGFPDIFAEQKTSKNSQWKGTTMLLISLNWQSDPGVVLSVLLFCIVTRNNQWRKERVVFTLQWKLLCLFLKLGFDAATTDFFEDSADQQSGTVGTVVQPGVVFYLVVVYQVENQVYVSMYGLVLSQLRFHSVQPVNESLESVCKLAGEQQGLLKLVLSAGEHKSSTMNE